MKKKIETKLGTFYLEQKESDIVYIGDSDDFDGSNIEDDIFDIRFNKDGGYCYDYEESMIKKITKKRKYNYEK